MARTPRILIIEDNDSISNTLHYLFRLEGYTTVTAKNGLAGLVHLQSMGKQDLPDLILLDLMMPKMDGIEFRRRMLEDKKISGIPVIVLSSLDPSQENLNVLGDRVEYLTKPVGIEQLLTRVKKHCYL